MLEPAPNKNNYKGHGNLGSSCNPIIPPLLGGRPPKGYSIRFRVRVSRF